MVNIEPVNYSTPLIGKIPVENLWLLMLYASDLYREIGKKLSSIEDAPDEIPDLIGKMLCSSVKKRIRRNLSSGYKSRQDHLTRLRGRIDVLETSRHHLLAKGRIACRFEELTVDTPRNRYIKSALEKIALVVKNSSLSSECRSHAKQLQMMGVNGEKPSATTLSKETFGRNDADDKQLIELSRLAFELALPSEVLGKHYIQSPDRDVVFVRKLFEKGVAGLYAMNLPDKGWAVRSGRKLNWQIDDQSDGIESILPSMKTDIELESEDQHIVIDTKFNSVLTTGWYRDETLRSGYLYQMYAYLRSQENEQNPKTLSSSGILLHPCVEKNIDEEVCIQGHRIRFVTIDLTSSAISIHSQLIEIVVSNPY